MPTVGDYSIGDVIVHRAIPGKAWTGRVVALEYEGKPHVVVEYPPTPNMRNQVPWRGAYDDTWLRMHPTGLLIDRSNVQR